MPLAIVRVATIVADSARFSALVTEVAPSHAVGTALPMLALGPAAGIAALVRLARVHGRGAEPSIAAPAAGPPTSR